MDDLKVLIIEVEKLLVALEVEALEVKYKVIILVNQKIYHKMIHLIHPLIKVIRYLIVIIL